MDVTIQTINEAAKRLENIPLKSPLQFSKRISKKYKANIYIKREDLQEVRSFKIRGAYNKMASLSEEERKNGVVCASAGNHAQGVAYSCALLKIKGTIFMPITSPNQKIQRVKHFGENCIEVRLEGNTFDEAAAAAKAYAKEHEAVFIHAFDDPLTISGQGTVGKEIYDTLANFGDPTVTEKYPRPFGNGENPVDVILSSIGGGGLISGVASYMKGKNTEIKIIGVEPGGAASMHTSIKNGKVTPLTTIDSFVDGAAVGTVGNIPFEICRKYVDHLIAVPEGKICMTMIELYQNEGIVAEPAGALSLSALDDVADMIEGKTVVAILSGGNNDLLRYPEILERSLVYQGRKHYFLIEFAQKPGQLRQFLDKAMGPSDDIVRFEYIKRTNKEKGPALVGIELQKKEDLQPLMERMKAIELNYRFITNEDLLYQYLI